MALPFNLTPQALVSDAVLGLNLLTGTLRADVVGVLDQETFEQVFAGARPMKAFIRENSQIMKHPLERGTMIADHQVIEPRTIELLVMVDAPDFAGAFQQIRSLWQNKTLLIVQTRAALYQNMVIKSLPREETPEKIDVTTISLQMEEVIFALPGGTSQTTSVSYYSPAAPNNQSIVLRGLQNAITSVSSVFSAINALSVWGIR